MNLLRLIVFVFVFSGIALGADENFFPIMVWNTCPADLAQIQRMKDCGITIAGFSGVANLPLVQQAGMKAFIGDPRASSYAWTNVDSAVAEKNAATLAAEVAKNPAAYGYFLDDEPSTAAFPGLAKLSQSLREKSDGLLPFINLLPTYANNEQLGAGSYQEYLDKFVATCHPSVLCYDHYALMDNGSLRDGYWQNLEAVRATSLKNKIPFWVVLLSCAHFNYREPSAADLRFQVYSTLAYGGRGIGYFTYFCPAVGNYRAAPIDQFGHETPTWAAMQSVNLQVLKLAPVLNQLTSTRVYHFGKTTGGAALPADSLLTSAGNEQFMAGEFVHADGSSYVMIVNKNVTHSAPVDLHFRTAPKKVEMISPYSGEATPFEGEQAWLAPGAGVLLKLKP